MLEAEHLIIDLWCVLLEKLEDIKGLLAYYTKKISQIFEIAFHISKFNSGTHKFSIHHFKIPPRCLLNDELISEQFYVVPVQDYPCLNNEYGECEKIMWWSCPAKLIILLNASIYYCLCTPCILELHFNSKTSLQHFQICWTPQLLVLWISLYEQYDLILKREIT